MFTLVIYGILGEKRPQWGKMGIFSLHLPPCIQNGGAPPILRKWRFICYFLFIQGTMELLRGAPQKFEGMT